MCVHAHTSVAYTHPCMGTRTHASIIGLGTSPASLWGISSISTSKLKNEWNVRFTQWPQQQNFKLPVISPPATFEECRQGGTASPTYARLLRACPSQGPLVLNPPFSYMYCIRAPQHAADFQPDAGICKCGPRVLARWSQPDGVISIHHVRVSKKSAAPPTSTSPFFRNLRSPSSKHCIDDY
jgi:hypothetical protein